MRVSRREEKDRRRGNRRWKTLVMTMWSRRIHTSGVQRKWLLWSDNWELLNVFSLSEIKYSILEWMTVFSSQYPSTTFKVCVDMFVCMTTCSLQVLPTSVEGTSVMFSPLLKKKFSSIYTTQTTKGYERHTRCGCSSFQRWQSLVRSVSENLGWQLQSILEQEESVRERHWP